MTTAAHQRQQNDVEEIWWEAHDEGTPAHSRSNSRSASPRRRAALPVRMLAAPFVLLGRWGRSNAHVRRAGIRAIVIVVVLSTVAGAVGVILLNNEVIARTSELGKLDDKRRELRRENALLGAESARRSASPVVAKRAARDLGMVSLPALPTFMYLDPSSRTLTNYQRIQFAKRELARRDRLDARAATAAAAAEATTKEAP